jgi:hypothetical protein
MRGVSCTSRALGSASGLSTPGFPVTPALALVLLDNRRLALRRGTETARRRDVGRLPPRDDATDTTVRPRVPSPDRPPWQGPAHRGHAPARGARSATATCVPNRARGDWQYLAPRVSQESISSYLYRINNSLQFATPRFTRDVRRILATRHASVCIECAFLACWRFTCFSDQESGLMRCPVSRSRSPRRVRHRRRRRHNPHPPTRRAIRRGCRRRPTSIARPSPSA